MKILLCVGLLALGGASLAAQSYILDADTGNEMDDWAAIAYVLGPAGLDVSALQSAHYSTPHLLFVKKWNGLPTDSMPTVAISQYWNERLLAACGRFGIPALRGCTRPAGPPWGYESPLPLQSAPAVRYLIDQGRKAPEGEKLNIICTGPTTNVAMAIAAAPELAARFRVYLLGGHYDAKRRAWNKNEFNIRNDLNAFDFLLEQEELELWIMPANVAGKVRVSREGFFGALEDSRPALAELLRWRWQSVGAGADWAMWDIALAAAIKQPEWALWKKARVPPENGRRKVWVCMAIEEERIAADFLFTLSQWR